MLDLDRNEETPTAPARGARVVSRPWAAILGGALAERAVDAAREIAQALAADPSAACATDRTLFWAYASARFDEPFARAAYDRALDDLLAELSSGAPYPGLCGGLAGMGFALAHVLESDSDRACRAIDEALLRVLGVDAWHATFDLTNGLVGLGVYFLERLRGGAGDLAREGVERVVRHLAAMARHEPDGATWFTPPELLPPHSRETWPRGVSNCGLAHGAPGVIALLSRAAALPGAPRTTHTLRDDAARWLVARRGAPAPRGRFPSSIADGVAEPARAAWCYGDPGVACGLWSAAPHVARELALDCARREVEHCIVRDAGLCHGAAGLAHMLDRWYQSTGDERLAVSARAWFERALAFLTPAGFGGVVCWSPTGAVVEANLVEGAIGVALALLAATGDSEPGWDRMLLCDLA